MLALAFAQKSTALWSPALGGLWLLGQATTHWTGAGVLPSVLAL